MKFPTFSRKKTKKKKPAPRILAAIERLEKQSWQLSLLTILVICALVGFIIINHLEKMNGSLRDWWKNPDLLHVDVLASTVVIFLFGIYIFWKSLRLRTLRKTIFMERMPAERPPSLEQADPLFQISSAISVQKEIPAIMELIGRESLHSLKAHRATIFLTNGGKGVLKTQCTHAADPAHVQIGLAEEKEIARKAMRTRRPLLLAGPEDFSDFPNYRERPKKITSLMSIPLAPLGKWAGALSLALLDDDRRFSEKDLQLLCIFANQASIALVNANLSDQVRRASETRFARERSLEDLLGELQARSPDELTRVRDRIAFLLSPAAQSDGNGAKPTKQAETAAPGNEQKDDIVKLDIEEQDLSRTEDLNNGGLFIRTPDPLDLGEQFLLRLHLPPGEEPVEVSCKVIWTNKYGKESKHLHRGMGVKFLNLSAEAKKRIEEFINPAARAVASASQAPGNPASGNEQDPSEVNALQT